MRPGAGSQGGGAPAATLGEEGRMNGGRADGNGGSSSPAEVEVEAGASEPEPELARLEALLAERAQALGEQRAEVAWLRALLHGALDRFDTVAVLQAPAPRALDDGTL